MPKDPFSMMKGPFSSGSVNKLEPEYAQSYQQWKTLPNKTTTGALLRTVNPVIDKAIHSYGGGSKGSPTLRSRARKLALDAMPTYNPAKGSLQTHLLSQLRRLQRVAGQEQQIISVPEQIVLNRRQLAESEREMRDELGRDPSDGEIADRTGLSIKRIGYIRGAHVPVAEGTATDRPGVSSGEQFTPASTIPGRDPGADEWARFVYEDLGNKDQAIMDFTLGMNGAPKLQLTEIARRVGLSPGAVSQRTAKIQLMLNERDSAGLI